jgi:hypothetical protein
MIAISAGRVHAVGFTVGKYLTIKIFYSINANILGLFNASSPVFPAIFWRSRRTKAALQKAETAYFR